MALHIHSARLPEAAHLKNRLKLNCRWLKISGDRENHIRRLWQRPRRRLACRGGGLAFVVDIRGHSIKSGPQCQWACAYAGRTKRRSSAAIRKPIKLGEAGELGVSGAGGYTAPSSIVAGDRLAALKGHSTRESGIGSSARGIKYLGIQRMKQRRPSAPQRVVGQPGSARAVAADAIGLASRCHRPQRLIIGLKSSAELAHNIYHRATKGAWRNWPRRHGAQRCIGRKAP